MIYIDGSSRGNPGPAGIGIHIPEPAIQISIPVGEATNNQAEWLSLVVASYISQYIPGDATIYTDSRLVAEQCSGNWKIRNPELLELYELTRYYIDNQHSEIEVKHIRRNKNKVANMLAQEASASFGYIVVEKGLEQIIKRRLKEKNKKLSMAILPRDLISILPPPAPHGTNAIIPDPKAVVIREPSESIIEHYETVLVTSEKMWYVNGKPYKRADWL